MLVHQRSRSHRRRMFGADYQRKVLSVERENLIHFPLQNEESGSVSFDSSGHDHHGAYTDVDLGQPGVPGMRMSSAGYDGAASFNNVHSAGLANDNLLSNPGFETAGGGDPDIWANWLETAGDGALANEAVIVHEGNDAAKITTGGSANTLVHQDVTVVAGKKYRLRFWTRGDGTYGGRYRLRDTTNSADIVSAITTGITGTSYTALVKEFTAPAGCTTVRFYFYCSGTGVGAVAYLDACEVRSMDGFLGDEGTVLAWAKVSAAGVWTDSTTRQMVYIGADTENRVRIGRNTTNNTIFFGLEAGNVAPSQATAGLSNTDFACYVIAWSKSGNAINYYIAGAASGAADVYAGTWVGDVSATYCVIGATEIAGAPSNVWSGEIGPVALWNKALTADQIAYLSKV